MVVVEAISRFAHCSSPLKGMLRIRGMFFGGVILIAIFIGIWLITYIDHDFIYAKFNYSCYDMDSILKDRWSSKKVNFHPVGSLDLFVFSVYGDTRFGNLIRFVGFGIHKNYNGLKCLLLQDRKITEINAEVEYLPEGHRLKYDAVFINCKSHLSLTTDSFVGLTDSPCSYFDFFLPLEIIPRSTRKSATSGITLCIPPTHSNFYNVDRFVEFMELNQLLGFKKFVFYDYSISKNVGHVMQKYVGKGLVSIIPWDIPVPTGSKVPIPNYYQIHYFGQLVAIHDCLLRVMNRPYRFVAFHDVDEFLIPKKEATLLPFLKLMDNTSVAGLSFANAKFDVPDFNTTTNRLISLASTKRYTELSLHGERSKMIVDANRIAWMGIHCVWKYIDGYTEQLSPNEAILHHYQKWFKTKDLVDDETALRYKDKLIKNFNNFFLELEKGMR